MRGDSYTSSKDFHHKLHPPNNAVLRLSSLDHDVSRHSTTSVTALLSFNFVSFHTHTLLPRRQAHLRLPQISPTTSIITIISIINITPIQHTQPPTSPSSVPPITPPNRIPPTHPSHPHPLTSSHPHPPPHHLPLPFPPAPPTVSSPNTLLAAMNLHPPVSQPHHPSIHP